MPQLLLELFSEEIPARMQLRAAADLQRLIGDGLKAAGIAIGEAHSYVTPRRLTLVIEDLPAKSPAVSDERKGPRVGAPDKAIEGFVKGAGLASIQEADIVSDAKKGDYYVARIDKPGRVTADILAEVIPDAIRKFPWPKSMRWGDGTLAWVRPLQSILCLLGGKVVAFDVDGIKAGKTTRGHRFLSDGEITVKDFADYRAQLKAAHVLLDSAERAAVIAEQARALAAKHKLQLVEDEALLAENAGLNEWPSVLMGEFDKAFLDVPGEVLTTSMKAHQKCFSLKDKKTGKLANKFLLVSNLKATDGGKAIIAGNEKVIRARLADAKFFWDKDLERPLDDMVIQLGGITFHEKLGTQKERVERIAELAHSIAGSVDADLDDARRAAQLCKADLVSGMVGEFPELQGLMGRYYAEAGGIKPEIARAIELHYKPKGPGDTVPLESQGDAVAVAVALADKLDTLVGFWAINEKPTGSGDPYQLRRAALGVIRLVLENDVRLPLLRTFLRQGVEIEAALVAEKATDRVSNVLAALRETSLSLKSGEHLVEILEIERKRTPSLSYIIDRIESYCFDLLSFFADRLKVHLREAGARHDLIDAIFSLGTQDDLALIVRRVEALSAFLTTDDGANLLAGVKRAANILAIEEKKDKASFDAKADEKLLKAPEEKALLKAVRKVANDTVKAIDLENFQGAMNALAELRAPVDAFFDKVTVNDPDASLRANRLRLLAEIRAATLTVADFSKIAG